MKKVIVLLFLILFVSLPVTAYEDIGPKRTLEIFVKNPPQVEYYLDILSEYEPLAHSNLRRYKDTYDPQKIALLEGYHDITWTAVLTSGSQKPVWGDLVGHPEDGRMLHKFSNRGVPDRFRIIIVTTDNKIVKTQAIETQGFNTRVVYDYTSGSLTLSDGDSLEIIYFRQLFIYIIPAFLLKGFFLGVFRFDKLHTMKTFFFINLLTQPAISIIMSIAMQNMSLTVAYPVYAAVMLVFTIIEAVSFAAILKEGKRAKRIAYAICSNMVAALAGVLSLYYAYKLYFI